MGSADVDVAIFGSAVADREDGGGRVWNGVRNGFGFLGKLGELGGELILEFGSAGVWREDLFEVG